MHSMGGNCSRDGALKNVGVQFRIDMAFRLVKRNEEGKPVNPRVRHIHHRGVDLDLAGRTGRLCGARERVEEGCFPGLG